MRSNIWPGMRVGIGLILVISAVWLMIPSPAFLFMLVEADALNDTQYVSENDGIDSTLPQVAASGSNVYVVWQDDDEILLASSSDNGATFSPTPINISN
ncbi:MAG: hypothetical protein ACRD5H_06535, partial [Nitrososphaerales archaeon]